MCGSSVIESARSIPANAARPRSVSWKKPPYAASTWSHRSCSAATSAISAIGSIAPVLVVPADATTKNGVRPAARSATSISRSASTSIRSSGVHATERTFALGNPAIAAAFALDAWTCSET